MSKKKLVFVGGGSGIAEIFREIFQKKNTEKKLKKYEISAIISVFDDGGSTGRLRKNFKIPAVGDLRNVISAASEKSTAEIFEKRTEDDHAVGNLSLAFLIQKFGFEKAVEKYQKMLDCRATVIPAALEKATLVGKFHDGEIVGEHAFDKPPRDFAGKKIEKIRLRPAVDANPAALKKLKTADVIVVGPGSFFGSLLVNFLPRKLADAFAKSRARKIFVVPGTAEFGCRRETAEQLAARFPVEFDKVWQPEKKQRWDAKKLAAKILT